MIKGFLKAAMPAAILLAVAACGQSDLSKLEDDSASGAGPVAGAATAEQKIKIVGSSTVAPVSRTIAERFGATTAFGTPIVESTGTGGGFKAFCSGVGPDQPSISNASRPIKDSERNLCVAAGVTSITEIPLGYDGIVIANAKEGPEFDLTKQELYLALAKDIPDGKGGFMPNPYKAWNEVAPNLPAEPILVLGPPPTSGTRDAFVELGMELGALEVPELAELKKTDEEAFKNYAHTIRTDGAWVDFGENDTALVQSLVKSPEAIETFKRLEVDAACVVAYGQILKAGVLEAPRLGCFNLHGSLLPRWRGAAPIQRAIMAGDRQTGVQIMRMSEGLDEGAILLSEILDIRADDTAASLGERMSHIGAALWPRALAAIERGAVEGTEQVGEPTYAKKITPAEARIDWSRSAAEVDAHIRGLSPFPGAWFEVPGEDGPVRIKVLMSRVAPDGAGAPGQVLDGGLRIACGEGAVDLLRVQRAGKAAQSAEEMLRGFPLPPGTVLG